MNGLITLIAALAPLALQELEALTGLSPNVAQLVQGIVNALQTFVSLFKGNADTATVASVLSALEASVTVLQSQTSLDPKALAITNALLKAIAAGNAVNNSLTTVDPTQLQPIQPVQ